MKQSQLFLNTLREVPGDSDAVSHQLMVRAGLIRQLTTGVYSFLPLGFRVLKKIEDIVRREMDAAGAQEVLLPAMQPANLWQDSGRFDDYGPELIRFTDRHQRQTVLGPTHEEVVTSLVQNEIRSYRQLPITLYQIQTKFRDERRPRAGLLRGREFRMKDAYSFDVDIAGLDDSYNAMYKAYCRVFDTLGVQYLAVEADGGAIGDEGGTREFMVLSDAGEDSIVVCPTCSYAANVEKAVQQAGETCTMCGSTLQLLRGIEVGHIFKLGTRYSKPFGATFLDGQGKEHTIVMGCYGIGTSRLIPAIVEQCHDENGIIWPVSVAPFLIHIVPVNTKDGKQMDTAADVYTRLGAAGFDVLLDDRAERPGVKFKDADLLGLPLRITVGSKVQDGSVEIRIRKTGESQEIALDQVPTWCRAHFKTGN